MTCSPRITAPQHAAGRRKKSGRPMASRSAPCSTTRASRRAKAAPAPSTAPAARPGISISRSLRLRPAPIPARARRRTMAIEIARRELLIGPAAVAALGGIRPAEAAAAKPYRVDLHHHILPPKWIEAARSHKPDNTWGPELLRWTPAVAIEQMDR